MDRLNRVYETANSPAPAPTTTLEGVVESLALDGAHLANALGRASDLLCRLSGDAVSESTPQAGREPDYGNVGALGRLSLGQQAIRDRLELLHRLFEQIERHC